MRKRRCREKQEARRTLPAVYTVEAAGVMAAVLFTIMTLIGQAFRIQAKTLGNFGLHLQVEAERHKIENSEKLKITEAAEGNGWSLEISAPVYRPERFLRMWSLTEGLS